MKQVLRFLKSDEQKEMIGDENSDDSLSVNTYLQSEWQSNPGAQPTTWLLLGTLTEESKA